MEKVILENREALQELQPKQNLLSIGIGPTQQADMVRYAGAAGDFNPIHNDLPFAKSNSLDGTIVFGMYTMALLGRVLEKCVCRNTVRSFRAKFKDIIYVNDTINCEAIVKKISVSQGSLTLTLNAYVGESLKASAEAHIEML